MLPGLEHRLLPERGDLVHLHFSLPGFDREIHLEGVLQLLPSLRHELLPDSVHGPLDAVLD